MTYSANLSFFAAKTSDTGAINSGIDGVPIGANTAAAGSFTTINASTSITNAGLTSGRVTYAGASGLLSDSSGLTFDGTIFQVKTGNTAVTQFRIAHSTAANFYADYNEKGDLTVNRNSWSAGVTTVFSTTSATATYTGDLAGGFSFSPRGNLAVTIAGNGLVGIGTTSPIGKLQIDSTNVDPSATATGITLINSTSPQATSNGGSISLGGVYTGSSITQFGYILGAKANSTDGNYAGYLSFGTRPNGDVSQERMRIDSSGNVGIGTSSPSAKLNVVGGVTFQNSTLEFGNVTTSANQFVLQYMASGNGYYSYMGVNGSGAGVIDISGISDNAVYYGSRSNVPLQFLTNNTIRATFDASGNLGIGETSPAKKLSITGTGNNDTSCSILTKNTNAGTGVQIGLFAYNGTQSAQITLAGTGYTTYGAYAPGNFVVYNDQAITLMADNPSTGIIKFATGGNTERMRIDSIGNLGLGVTPSAWDGRTAFQNGSASFASSSANRSVAEISANSYLSAGGIFRYLYSSANATIYQQAIGTHVWYTAASGTAGNAISFTQAMTLDASGNLLVGTTTQASSVSNTKSIVGGVINSFRGQINNSNSGTAYTMFTMTADFATYIVTVSGLASSASYSETAIVHLNNTSVTVTIIADGGSIVISNSGLNVQVTQNSGGTLGELIYSAMRIL